MHEEFEIVSVEPTYPPGDADGTGWHCYVIGQGPNAIRGYQQGSSKAVRRAVEEIVARLNERRYGKGGRVHLHMSAQKKKAARK